MGKEKKYHFIYRITNQINGKIYIGVHSTNNIEDGYMGSGLYLRKAQKVHGVENFKREIIYNCKTREEAMMLEAEIVDFEYLQRNDVYNLIIGGGTGGYIKKDRAIYSKSIKIQPVEKTYQHVMFEKMNEDVFYNIKIVNDPLIRAKINMMLLKKIDSDNAVIYKLLYDLIEELLPMCVNGLIWLVNNKHERTAAIRALNKMKKSVWRHYIKIEKQHWVQNIEKVA
jgi:hypothetical protein